jgi:hypothetical protein
MADASSHPRNAIAASIPTVISTFFLSGSSPGNEAHPVWMGAEQLHLSSDALADQYWISNETLAGS